MYSTIGAIARCTVLEALRSRLPWLVLAAVLAVLGVASFLAQLALTEAPAYRGAIAAALLRVVAVLIVCLFVVTSLLRELHDKGFEMLLALPISRAALLAGKLLGYGAVALAVAVLCALAAMLVAAPAAALMWGVSLAMELWLIAVLSVLCLFTFSQVPAAVAAVLAFYLLSRAVAAFQLIGHGPLMEEVGVAGMVMVKVVDALAFMLPELHRFTSSDWLVYGPAPWTELLPLAGQTLVYSALLVSAALFDLTRKNL